MILETDQALLAVTKARVLGNSAVAIVFDPPARPWIQALKTPAVNFFLFDIRENTHRRDVMYEEIRDEGGRVVGRRPPALRYDLHYTVSVWGAPVAVEHRVLALVLRCFGALPAIPREFLPEALAKLPYEVHLTTAAGVKRGMFLSLAGEVKAGFEMTVTVPMPALDLPVAPPVSRAAVTVSPVPAGAAGTAGAPETVQHKAPPKAPAPAPAPAPVGPAAAAQPAAAEPTQPAATPALRPADSPAPGA